MTSVPKPTPNQPDERRIALTDPSQITTGAGVVTLVVGAALAVKPEATARALGLGLGRRGARGLAFVDLALAPVLITGRNRANWMGLRALMNLGIAARYRALLRGGGGAQVRGGFVLMTALTVLDGVAACALGKQERRLG